MRFLLWVEVDFLERLIIRTQRIPGFLRVEIVLAAMNIVRPEDDQSMVARKARMTFRPESQTDCDSYGHSVFVKHVPASSVNICSDKVRT